MKLKITFKDPDGVYDSVHDAVEEEVNKIADLDEDEKESLVEARSEKVKQLLKKWITHEEYVTIEFDTDEGTAIVLKEK